MTLEDLIEALRRDVPEARSVLEAHLEDLAGGDEFVLMDVLRVQALALFADQRMEAFDRLLILVDRALAEGDDELAEAVATDFIATTAPWDPAMDAFVAAWPVHMRAQAAVETARFDDH